VIGVVLLLVALAAIGATGAVVAALIGVRAPAELVLAAYVLAFAEVVSLALLLSAFDALTRAALVLGALLILAGGVGAALLFGTNMHRRLPRRGYVASAVRATPVIAAGLAAALALAYVAALIVGTPPNGWDPLNYHLARAGLWLEAGQVG
jgi:energy-converting hydrogenase Eha subunit A